MCIRHRSVTVTTNDDRTISIDVTLNFGPQGLGRKAIEKIRELGIDTRDKLAKTAAEISTSYAACLNKVCTTLRTGKITTKQATVRFLHNKKAGKK